MTGNFQPVGSIRMLPRQTTNYVFTIIGDGKPDRTIDHKVKVLPPDIIYFSAPRTINKGNEARLSWLVKGQASVRIEGVKDNLKNRGQLNVTPEKTTTYKLVIETAKIKREKTVTVKVVERRNFVRDVTQFDKLGSGNRIDFEIFAIDYSNFPENVKLKMLVVDSKGNFVNGLAPPFMDDAKSRKYIKELLVKTNGKDYPISGYSIKEVHGKEPKLYDIACLVYHAGYFWTFYKLFIYNHRCHASSPTHAAHSKSFHGCPKAR